MKIFAYPISYLLRQPRPASYLDELRAIAVRHDNRVIELDVESPDYLALVEKYRDAPKALPMTEAEQHHEPKRATTNAQPVKGCSTCGEPPKKKTGVARVIHGGKGLVKATIGADAVTPHELARRQSICNACPKKTAIVFGVAHQCAECGCLLQAKQRLQSESCPIGKW